MQEVLEETLLQLQAFVPKPGAMCCVSALNCINQPSTLHSGLASYAEHTFQ